MFQNESFLINIRTDKNKMICRDWESLWCLPVGSGFSDLEFGLFGSFLFTIVSCFKKDFCTHNLSNYAIKDCDAKTPFSQKKFVYGKGATEELTHLLGCALYKLPWMFLVWLLHRKADPFRNSGTFLVSGRYFAFCNITDCSFFNSCRKKDEDRFDLMYSFLVGQFLVLCNLSWDVA